MLRKRGMLTYDDEVLTKIKYHTYYNCTCDCGKCKLIRKASIEKNGYSSCGCQSRAKRFKKTHGMNKTRFYHIWANMKDRCLNPKCFLYSQYGGRGISVDTRWINFENFYHDMFTSYADNLSIERIDNNKGYFRENCIWADAKHQARNRRSNHLISYQGKMLPIFEVAELIGMNKITLHSRIWRGWPVERAITEPVHTIYSRKAV